MGIRWYGEQMPRIGRRGIDVIMEAGIEPFRHVGVTE